MRSTTKRRRSPVPSANHVRLGSRGRRHHFKEMDQGDRLLDCVVWTKMSYNPVLQLRCKSRQKVEIKTENK